jgi:WD40 repeat protein
MAGGREGDCPNPGSFVDETGRLAAQRSSDPAPGHFTMVTSECIEAHGAQVNVVRYSSDGKFIASGSRDCTVRIWKCSDAGDTSVVDNLSEEDSGDGGHSHKTRLSTIVEARASWHPDRDAVPSDEVLSMDWVKAIDSDHLLLFGTGNHMVKMWSVSRQSVVMEMAAGAGAKDGRVEAAFQFPRVLDIASSPRHPIFVVATAPSTPINMNGTSACGHLATYDLTKKILQTIPLDPPTVVNTVSFNHNGSLLVAGAADGMVRLFDIRSRSALQGWLAHDGEIKGVQFSPDDMHVITVGADGQMLEWSLHNSGTQPSNVKKFKHFASQGCF